MPRCARMKWANGTDHTNRVCVGHISHCLQKFMRLFEQRHKLLRYFCRFIGAALRLPQRWGCLFVLARVLCTSMQVVWTLILVFPHLLVREVCLSSLSCMHICLHSQYKMCVTSPYVGRKYLNSGRRMRHFVHEKRKSSSTHTLAV